MPMVYSSQDRSDVNCRIIYRWLAKINIMVDLVSRDQKDFLFCPSPVAVVAEISI